METITKILTVPAQGAYYYEDVVGLQESSVSEEERWLTPSKTPGFKRLREVAEVVSVGIVSSSGRVSWGDCVGVSYAGKSGREPLFRKEESLKSLAEISSALEGKPLASFRELCGLLENYPAHKAVHYGMTQALLAAVAEPLRLTMTEVICREWDLPLPTQSVPLHGSSGNERKRNAEKMIANRLEILPHGQIDSIGSQLGGTGEILLEYTRWLRERIGRLGGADYSPIVHLDVHGAIGKIFDRSISKTVQYLLQLEQSVSPYLLRLESIILGDSKAETLALLKALKSELREQHSRVEIVADEWANTRQDILDFAYSGVIDMIHIKMPDLGGIQESIETVLALRKLNTKSLLGGSCIETDLSTKASIHVALATQPTAFLTKPGMGVDEAIMLVKNEMVRTLLMARTSR